MRAGGHFSRRPETAQEAALHLEPSERKRLRQWVQRKGPGVGMSPGRPEGSGAGRKMTLEEQAQAARPGYREGPGRHSRYRDVGGRLVQRNGLTRLLFKNSFGEGAQM